MKILKLIISITLPLLIGFVGSLFTTPSIATWYETLNKPSFNPPNYLFAPVWTSLFILMGIALFLIWKDCEIKNQKSAFGIFSIQLILNLLWSIIFFGLHNPTMAFIEILILLIFIKLNIVCFFRIKKISGILLIPYLLWVIFASFLNYNIIILN